MTLLLILHLDYRMGVVTAWLANSIQVTGYGYQLFN